MEQSLLLAHLGSLFELDHQLAWFYLFHLDSEMATEKYSTRIYSPFPRQKYSSCCFCLHLRASPVIYNYLAPHVMIVGIGPRSGVLTYFCSTLGPEVASLQGGE